MASAADCQQRPTRMPTLSLQAVPNSLERRSLPRRPRWVASWGPANLSALNFTHREAFRTRDEPPSDGWASAIWANQFPEHCQRFLLVKDDLWTAGLGVTVSHFANALLLALRDNRVMIEVPAVPRHNISMHSRPNSSMPWWCGGNCQWNDGRPRWCDRPPYTLSGCFYQSWTHCTVQTGAERALPPNPKHFSWKSWPHESPVVAISTTWLAKAWRLWMGVHGVVAKPAAVHFLLRPRTWVSQLAACTMHAARLRNRRFLSVHIRLSAEKQAEMAKMTNAVLPPAAAYCDLATDVAARLRLQHVFVQSANAAAIANFTSCARSRGLEVSFTRNARSEHDSWGGILKGAEMLQAVIAAVNAAVSSHAAALMSPPESAMTNLLCLLLRHPMRPLAHSWLTCKTKSSSRHTARGKVPGLLGICAACDTDSAQWPSGGTAAATQLTVPETLPRCRSRGPSEASSTVSTVSL